MVSEQPRVQPRIEPRCGRRSDRRLLGPVSLLCLGALTVSGGLSPIQSQEEPRARVRSVEVDENGQVVEQAEKHAQNHQGSVRTWLAVEQGRGYLGVQISELTPELREFFGAPRDTGLLVSRVDPGSPAERAGIEVGDVLTAMDGAPVDHGVTLLKSVRAGTAGDTVDVEVFRDRRKATLVVELGEREPVAALAFRPMLDGRLRVSPLGSEGVEVDIDEALGQLDTFFGSAQWLETLESLEGVELDHVEERMREVEERIRQLEKELQEKSGDPE